MVGFFEGDGGGLSAGVFSRGEGGERVHIIKWDIFYRLSVGRKPSQIVPVILFLRIVAQQIRSHNK